MEKKQFLKYLNETSSKFDLDKKIKYNHWVNEICWNSTKNEWTVVGIDRHKNKNIKYNCRFLMSCTGYYDYDIGYTPKFKGIENYRGNFIHPQKWTEDIDYSNKKCDCDW